MKKNFIKAFVIIMLTGSLVSCNKKLDLLPTNDITSATVYTSAEGYKQVFAKVYGSFALTGNQGPAGNGDVQGIDEGTSDFLRLFWKSQELSTDEAVIAWGDVGIQDFHNMNWSPANPFLKGLYYRSLYQITLANEFIRQSADGQLSSRGISGADADKIRQFRAEARFLRAFQYWVLLDAYGSTPLVTETDLIGVTVPKQVDRKTLFNYVESELKAIEPGLAAPRANEYGRADQAAEWALLARLYLNAEVYTGTKRYDDAITYSKKVIGAGYSLVSNYKWIMLADNQQNTSENIFTINYDGLRTQSYGGTTFLTHAPVGGSESASNFGISGGWSGARTTKNLPNLFPDYTGSADKRAQFYTNGQNLEIKDQSAFTDGFAVTKYRNVDRNGVPGKSLDYADVDFPIFRLSEMYLIYAESVLRGGAGGDLITATTYINNIRTRAYGNVSGNVAGITLDFILDERARELYWEGFRRTDLVRYGRFTTAAYLWPFKGGVANGKGVEDFRNIYPIPTDDITANPTLKQNPGY
ncbi:MULTISPECIES: RagB/SusD family nutrient uptake outer membrane protein [unclassified Mucilaginibacter]|uniref:RagB/SusD family nutrient uptake outer membrane protein n=2 Tax=Mucilaginibacter TaxID=423349 RepID=UPI002AC8B065|nr:MULTISPECIES: RagB/SusD family nutrient uptake outer membrane protein [unclassified Mucilaginibacter]MEB0278228.1 RagB/SusD family nutrient uptake outer membrane protein [Mucilaginibacter sp. 10B2]MEB0300986.1 RagB/SusD family nutrient uptake outer membrane protein [Mucilaginibacter sp. 5C4]WPX23873.1 RagB/SusD family nutrient uptake outer membrane protein [Mucilaginibacter sp. 5C4]